MSDFSVYIVEYRYHLFLIRNERMTICIVECAYVLLFILDGQNLLFIPFH